MDEVPLRDVVAVGGSAGAHRPLIELCAMLPAEFPAPVLVVLHVAPFRPSALPAMLDRAGPLPARHAQHGEMLRPAQIYVAPPDHHLRIAPDGRALVDRGPRENRHRPAIDVLFASVAAAAGTRAVAVLLSGADDDGTVGASAVSAGGGTVIVQDPGDAPQARMPLTAVEGDHPHLVLPAEEIAPALCRAVAHDGRSVRQPGAAPASRPGTPPGGRPGATRGPAAAPDGWSPTGFSCPACDGVLWEPVVAEVPHFRCRIGHAFTAEALLAEQDPALEATLWAAVRLFEERAELCRTLAEGSAGRGHAGVRQRFERRARDAAQQAGLLRGVLERHALLGPAVADTGSGGAVAVDAGGNNFDGRSAGGGSAPADSAPPAAPSG